MAGKVWRRIEVWVLVMLTLLFLGAGLHILLSNNRISTDAVSEKPNVETIDSITHRRASGHYAPPTQPSVQQGVERTSTPINDQSIELSSDYVGAPDRTDTPTAGGRWIKLQLGQHIDLNAADTMQLRQVPGVGVTFARRIAQYRDRLGGYYTVLQLQEIWGMDAERYRQIKPYFSLEVEPYKYDLSRLKSDSIPYHPYLNRAQRTALSRLIRKEGPIESWSRIMMLEEFNRDDSIRLSHYFQLP